MMPGHAMRHTLAWAAAGVVLLLVFLAYLHPELAFTLANQLWNCF